MALISLTDKRPIPKKTPLPSRRVSCGIEERDRNIVFSNQQRDLGASQHDPFGSLFHQAIDNCNNIIPRLLKNTSLTELIVNHIVNKLAIPFARNQHIYPVPLLQPTSIEPLLHCIVSAQKAYFPQPSIDNSFARRVSNV